MNQLNEWVILNQRHPSGPWSRNSREGNRSWSPPRSLWLSLFVCRSAVSLPGGQRRRWSVRTMVAVEAEVEQVLINTTTNGTSNLTGISDPSTSMDLYTRVSLTLIIGTFSRCLWRRCIHLRGSGSESRAMLPIILPIHIVALLLKHARHIWKWNRPNVHPGIARDVQDGRVPTESIAKPHRHRPTNSLRAGMI